MSLTSLAMVSRFKLIPFGGVLVLVSSWSGNVLHMVHEASLLGFLLDG